MWDSDSDSILDSDSDWITATFDGNRKHLTAYVSEFPRFLRLTQHFYDILQLFVVDLLSIISDYRILYSKEPVTESFTYYTTEKEKSLT